MIKAFRAKGMKVLWVNWGLDGRDLRDMPPALLAGFSDDGGPLSKSFESCLFLEWREWD